MGDNLVTLAETYLVLEKQIADVRNRMRMALANGAGDTEARPPTQPVRSSGGRTKPKPKATQHPAKPKHPPHAEVLAKAKEAERQIADLLRSRPGLRPAEIAKATASRPSTTLQRLQRMLDRGEVAGKPNRGV
jgi:hypothetical protein